MVIKEPFIEEPRPDVLPGHEDAIVATGDASSSPVIVHQDLVRGDQRTGETSKSGMNSHMYKRMPEAAGEIIATQCETGSSTIIGQDEYNYG